ncbi:unnamed protein product [Ectocarpus sp. 4 AP-2014]
MSGLRRWTMAIQQRRCRMRLPPGSAAPSASATTSTTTNPSPASAAPPTVSASPTSSLWPSTADLVDGILAGSRASLSRAITLEVESHRLDHRRQAELLLDRLLSARPQAGAPPPPPLSQPPYPPPLPPEESVTDSASGGSWSSSLSTSPDSGTAAAAEVAEVLASSGRRDCSSGRAVAATGDFPKLGMRLGIAGPPGAGKSSFIEVLGKSLTSAGNRVAVISIDPSSLRTGGSILGDKTRMDELSRDPSAFVRGCPARGVLGGLSRYTHEVVLLCQVAGYDPVIVETVGLGQNEVEVEHTVDMLLLMLPPAGGDDLQGSKKGIVEVADAIVVNKSDGDLEKAARATASDYSSALGYARRKLSCWAPPVLRCSALRSEGVDQVWEQARRVVKFRSLIEGNGLLGSRRRQQAAHWMRQHLRQQLMDRAVADAEVQILAKSLEIPLAFGKLSPRAAAERLVDCLLGDDNNSNTTTSGNSNIHSGNRTR